MKKITPIARFENIVVQDLPEETLICDLVSNRVFCLNKTASEVWKQCDGKTEISEIRQNLSDTLKAKVDDEFILFTLGELASENLLAEKILTQTAYSGFSRREVIKKIGLSSMIALPLISSVVMPKAVHAQSGSSTCLDDTNCPNGQCCNNITQTCVPTGSNGCSCTFINACISACCQNSICVPADGSGTCPIDSLCLGNGDCASDCCFFGACSSPGDCAGPDCNNDPGQVGCPCNIDSDCTLNNCNNGICAGV